jgi:hypothetical protein
MATAHCCGRSVSPSAIWRTILRARFCKLIFYLRFHVGGRRGDANAFPLLQSKTGSKKSTQFSPTSISVPEQGQHLKSGLSRRNRRSALPGLPCARNHAISHGTKRPVIPAMKRAPRGRRSASALATPGKSSTQFNPEKLEKPPSKGPSLVRVPMFSFSMTRNSTRWLRFASLASRLASSTMRGEISHARTCIPREPK